MRRVSEGEAAFRAKQANTIAYLRRFKGFIAETDQKRSRAEKKEHDERKQKEDKGGELIALNAQLARSRRSRDRMARKNGTTSSCTLHRCTSLSAHLSPLTRDLCPVLLCRWMCVL